MSKRIISEADYERMVDRMVWSRLSRDPRYRNAENAEEQAEAEVEIEDEVCAELDAKYEVSFSALRKREP
jgi:hypothetical protein